MLTNFWSKTPVSGYQLYKKHFRQKLSEKDSERAEGEADTSSCKDKQEYALTNGGFQSDENGNTEGKGAVTHLWAGTISSWTAFCWQKGIYCQHCFAPG